MKHSYDTMSRRQKIKIMVAFGLFTAEGIQDLKVNNKGHSHYFGNKEVISITDYLQKTNQLIHNTGLTCADQKLMTSEIISRLSSLALSC